MKLIEKENDRYIDPKSGGRTNENKKRVRKKNHWYKRGGNEAVIFVSATPNAQLQMKYQKEIKRQGFKIKVVEKAGIAIKRLHQRSDSCKPRQCEREDCLVCRTGGKGPCDRQSVTFEVKCTECSNIYVGETSRSAYTSGRNTRSHLAIGKSDRPCGNIVRGNITMKFRDFK